MPYLNGLLRFVFRRFKPVYDPTANAGELDDVVIMQVVIGDGVKERDR